MPQVQPARRRLRTRTPVHRRVAAAAAALALLIAAPSALADGSVDVNSGAGGSSRHKLVYNATINAPYNGGYTVLRTYARAGETIQMGSSAMGLAGGSDNILVYPPATSFASPSVPGARATFLADPVFATAAFDCNADDPGTGRIATRAQELAGPAPNAGGYPPCEYTAPVDGIYAVLMAPWSLAGGAPPTSLDTPVVSTAQGASISIWDVTVRDGGGAVQPGRVFTNLLDLAAGTIVNPTTDFTVFAYTPAGHLYRVKLFSPKNPRWDLSANGSGVIDASTGAPISASFQWGPGGVAGYPPTLAPTHGEALAPQMWAGDSDRDGRYPIFFRTPDPIVISGPGGLAATRGYSVAPIAPQGGLSSALSFTGAGGDAGGTIAIDAPQLQGAAYGLTIDLDRNGGFGGGADVAYSGTLSGSGAAVSWNGRDATGALVACGTSYALRATSTLPALHLVQSDTANEAGVQIERLTLPADPLLGDPLAASYDDVDPYLATAITNAAPSAVTEGTSGPGFHSWSGQSGHTDFVDTWTSARQVTGTGAIEVRCNPAATNPPSQPGQPTPPRRHKPKAPRLALSVHASTRRARPGSVIGYRITVTNRGGAAAHAVKVCDTPPAGQRTLLTTPTAAGKRKPCWTVRRLAAGAKRVFRMTALVALDSGASVQRNRATVRAANVKGVRAARVTVRIQPLPQRACGSRLGRPLARVFAPFRC